MIKLIRGMKPAKLTDDLVTELTEKFKRDKTQCVWDRQIIKKSLLNYSYSKCCYCEVKLNEESKYLTVEHFHPKDKYPDEVVLWENLLPACSRCNSNKSNHDTKFSPIVDPTKDNPKDYLYLHCYRYKSIDMNQLGTNTIEVLYLNDTHETIAPRVTIGESILNKIDDLYNLSITDFQNDVKLKNRLINGIKGILKMTLPENEYSAVIATVLLEEEKYYLINYLY